MNIRKEGFVYIGISALISILLFLTRLRLLSIIPVAFVTWFFRDPERTVPDGEDLIISPADGTVLNIQDEDEENVGPCKKISIFMSVFNVHVNRAMISGSIMEKRYCPGKFHMANLGKKTQDNERMIHYIKNENGIFRVDQVAGLIARRISFWPETGDIVEAGQRIGLIRFGSLLECYLPAGVEIMVNIGDKTFAGQTVLGRVVK